MRMTVLGKTVGTIAAAGLVLAVAPGAMSTAQAAGCTYDSPAPSSTAVDIGFPSAQYGTLKRAAITVSATSQGIPQGKVRVDINGVTKATLTLSSNGTASYALPRTLASKRTHRIAVFYAGDNCAHNGSSKGVNYTVFKAQTVTKAKVKNAHKAKFKTKVKARTGVPVKKGKVVFTVKKQSGKTVARKVVRVRGGHAKVNLRDLGPGKYVLKEKYLGSRNFKVSKKAKKFRVR